MSILALCRCNRRKPLTPRSARPSVRNDLRSGQRSCSGRPVRRDIPAHLFSGRQCGRWLDVLKCSRCGAAGAGRDQSHDRSEAHRHMVSTLPRYQSILSTPPRSSVACVVAAEDLHGRPGGKDGRERRGEVSVVLRSEDDPAVHHCEHRGDRFDLVVRHGEKVPIE